MACHALFCLLSLCGDQLLCCGFCSCSLRLSLGVLLLNMRFGLGLPLPVLREVALCRSGQPCCCWRRRGILTKHHHPGIISLAFQLTVLGNRDRELAPQGFERIARSPH